MITLLMIYLVAFALWMIISIKKAPLGYEDKKGFHINNNGGENEN